MAEIPLSVCPPLFSVTLSLSLVMGGVAKGWQVERGVSGNGVCGALTARCARLAAGIFRGADRFLGELKRAAGLKPKAYFGD